MSLPTLSVIMSSYNYGHYLPEALRCVLEQSVRPVEVLVVDDASRDNSVAVVEEFSRKDPIVKLVRNPENQGVCRVFNRGLALARGDYVYGAAADDRVLPGFFEDALRMASRYPSAGIIFGDMVQVDDEGRTLNYFGMPGWSEETVFTPESFLRDYVQLLGMTHSLCASTIYRRECMVEFGGYPPGLGASTDTFVTKAIGLKYGGCYVPRPFMHWRYSPSSLANTIDPARVRQATEYALTLMRTPPYRGLFPEELIRTWQTSYVADQLRDLASKLPLFHESLRQREREQLRRTNESLGRLARIPLFNGLCLRLLQSTIRAGSRRMLRRAERQLYLHRDPTLKSWGLFARLCDLLLLPLRQKAHMPADAIRHVGGHCYAVPVELMGIYAPSDEESISFLTVREDSTPLEAPHSLREDIEAEGRGRYTHWDRDLYFSASDNSDPRTNGRRYTVSLPQTVLSLLKRLKGKLRCGGSTAGSATPPTKAA